MKKILVFLIKSYQKYISAHTAPCCRFTPTCSHYGIEAIERFGAFKGGLMTLWRILRCNPFVSGGYDPVPEKNTEKNKREKKKKYKVISYKK